MPRAFRLAAIFSLLLFLTGCATIPYSGTVHAGVTAQNSVSDALQFLPSGPSAGASAEEILRGFVDAATSPKDDWGVAREFLTNEAQKKWAPSQQVLIDDGNRSIRRISQTSYVVDSLVHGSLNEHGVYTASAPTPRHLMFTLAKNGTEWRIAGAPAGIIIDARVFVQTFAETPLYFYASHSATLVPDVRWFPSRASTATRVVQALLAGPVGWMSSARAVHSAFPKTALLVADSVPVDSGVATVDFDSAALRDENVDRNGMLAQLAASLSGVTEVSSVRMSISGTPPLSADVPSQNALQASPALADPVVLEKDGLHTLGTSQSASLTLLGAPLSILSPSALSVSADRIASSALTSGGVFAVNAGGGAKLIDGRSGQIAPQLDSTKYVWTAVRNFPTQLRVSTLDGKARFVTAPWGQAESLSAIAVSPDGTRLASIYRIDGRDQVCIAGIGRDTRGAPVSLGPCQLPYRTEQAADAIGWVDASHIAVSSLSDQTSILSVICIGGLSEQSSVPGRVSTITGTGSYKIARVATTEGDVLQQLSPSRWYNIAHGVIALATIN